MKRLNFFSIVSCLFVNTLCYAQFPAPHSFELDYEYIPYDEGALCGDKWVTAATCFTLQWEAPDTLNTEARLTGYNVYYCPGDYEEGMEIPISEGIIIFSQLKHTVWKGSEIEVFERGIMWITANYSSPEGESAPSNSQTFLGHMTSIRQFDIHSHTLIHNMEKGGIDIIGVDNIISYAVFRIDGTVVKSSTESVFNFIDTKNIARGVYIVKITTEDRVISEKIIIE